MRWLARAGFAARGVMYVIIGWIAVELAFHRSSQQADRTGALHTISATPGVFLIIAAVEAKPQQAKGIDSSLRVLASTPLGPWLLVLVAIGLIMFGLFSLCQAKWRRL
jgi:hypothetical protein